MPRHVRDTHEAHDIYQRFEWRHLWRKQFLGHIHAVAIASKCSNSGRESWSFRRRCSDPIRGDRFRIFVDEVVIRKVLLRVCRQSFIIYLRTSVSYSGIFHFRWCNRSFSGCGVLGVYQPTSRIKYKSKFFSVHSVKACSTSRRTAPLVLQHSIRRTWGVKLTPRPLYSLVEIPPTHWVAGWEDPRAIPDFAGCVPLLYSVRRSCDIVSEVINNKLT